MFFILTSVNLHLYTHTHVCVCVEREKEKERHTCRYNYHYRYRYRSKELACMMIESHQAQDRQIVSWRPGELLVWFYPKCGRLWTQENWCFQFGSEGRKEIISLLLKVNRQEFPFTLEIVILLCYSSPQLTECSPLTQERQSGLLSLWSQC